MAFPAVQGTPAETAVSTASTTHVINLPASIVAGELLLIILVKGTPAQTTPSFNALAGWTEIVDTAVSLGEAVWVRKADGTEGATVTFTSSASIRSASIAYRISGASHPALQAPELSTVATGSSTTPDATTCTPTGGAKDYLWISFFGKSGEELDDDTWVTAAPATPSAFGSLLQKACGTAGTNLAGMTGQARLASNAASLDAGAFTCAVTGTWRAYTIAIHPSPAAAPALGGFRGRGDTVGLGVDTWDYALSTDWSQNVDETFRIRYQINETAGVDPPYDWPGQLECRLNGGTYQNITTSSTICKAVVSSQFNDGDATTNLLVIGGLAFLAGTGSETGNAADRSLSNQQTESEYALQLVSADVADGDVVDIRPQPFTPGAGTLATLTVVEITAVPLGTVLNTDTEVFAGTLGAESSASSYGAGTLGGALNTDDYPP